MSAKFPFILCCCILVSSCNQKEVKIGYAASELFELATPQLKIDSLLFNKTAKLEAVFNMEGAEIRYTKDDSEVSTDAMLYENPLVVTDASEFRFRVFHPEYIKSKEVYTRLLKVKEDVSTAKVRLAPQADKNYKGDGPQALVDLKKGTTQFRAGNHWLGFQGKQVRVSLEFEKETAISKLIVSALNDHGSWIFLPTAIRVFGDGKAEIGSVSIPLPTEVEVKDVALLDVPVPTGLYKSIEIHIDLMEAIPEWHQGQGTAPFTFIDEILVE